MKIVPRRMFLSTFVMVAAVGRTDAQQPLLDFLKSLDYEAILEELCPIITPIFEAYGIPLVICDTAAPTAPTNPGPAPAPAPAPKAPKKSTSGVSAPVPPPSATP